MANDKKLSNVLAADAATGLPKSYGTDSSMSSIPTATSYMTLSSIIGRAESIIESMISPATLPTIRNIAGMIGMSLYIKTFSLLRGSIETASALEVQKMNENLTYPCNYCGSCPIWLAAFDHPDLKTYEDVIAECEAESCPLVGQKVIKED